MCLATIYNNYEIFGDAQCILYVFVYMGTPPTTIIPCRVVDIIFQRH